MENCRTVHALPSIIYRNRRVLILQSLRDVVSLRNQPFYKNHHFNQLDSLDNCILQVTKEVGEYVEMINRTQFDRIEIISFIDNCLLQMKNLNYYFQILKEDITRFPFDSDSLSIIPSHVFPTPPPLYEIENDIESTPSTASSLSPLSSPNFQSYNNSNNDNTDCIEICNNCYCINNNCDLCVDCNCLQRLSY
ncbi:hypothetical protein ACTFIW_002748 [Dictyostelium discoideum]